MADEKKAKRKVKISVPERKGYPGVWAGGKLFPHGQYEIEEPEDTINNLKSRAHVVVNDPGAAPTKLSIQGKSSSADLTPEDDEDVLPPGLKPADDKGKKK